MQTAALLVHLVELPFRRLPIDQPVNNYLKFSQDEKIRETKMIRAFAILSLATVALSACATTTPGPVDQRNSVLTQGNVQLNLRVGATTKAEVLNTFGSPNITTRDASGEEVWSYQRQATIAQSSSSGAYWSILLTGETRLAAGFAQSSRMMTLIITFNKSDVVSDFRSRTSDF